MRTRFFKSLGFIAILAITACGRSDNASEIKIIGGTIVTDDVMDERRLSTVALTTAAKLGENSPLENGNSFCSGTIVGPRAIVTAAHCLQKFDPVFKAKKDELILPNVSDFLVSFGTNVSKDGKLIRAAKIIPHPKWDVHSTLSLVSLFPANDIGMIILSEDIPEGYKPAVIAGLDMNLMAKELVLAGFGITTSTSDNNSGTLRQGEVRVLRLERFAKRIISGNLAEGACSGDSGGPAYVEKDGKLYFTGIASTGMILLGNCLGFRNTHVDVRHYAEWIKETMQAAN